MIRTLTAAALSVALPLGAVCAPLVHMHPGASATGHHHAHEVHAHLAGHSAIPVAPGGEKVDDHDADRAVYLEMFVAVAQASFGAPPAVVPSWQFRMPAEAPARHSLRIVHGHDPPYVATLGSRAPPDLPVLI